MTRTAGGSTDYYGVDLANKLMWANRGVNAAPTSGQTSPYQLLAYDAAGRMTGRERRDAIGTPYTQTYRWDGDDRLREVIRGGVSIFNNATYDAGGERVSKWDTWTTTHRYTQGPGGVIHDANANTIFTPGLAQRRNGVDRFLHTDWMGSTRYLSAPEPDGNGNWFPNTLRYDGYGNKTRVIGGNYHPTPFAFAGAFGYQTEYSSNTEPGLGLMYLEQRYYDPDLGRFITPDPIGFAGGLNLYAYCGNDPVNAVDPRGLTHTPLTEDLWKTDEQRAKEAERAQFIRRMIDVLSFTLMMAGLPDVPGAARAGGSRAALPAVPCSAGASGAGVLKEAPKITMRSLIKVDKRLVRAAEEAGKGHQKEIDGLFYKLSLGNMNPGKGSNNLFRNVNYARSDNGGRLFFRTASDGAVEILAKANKANEPTVIKVLKEIYGKR